MPAQAPIIHTAHLFAELDGLLIDLFESLSRDEWTRRTIVPRWNVHQVAAHLLDTALRRLSMCRDRWVAPDRSPATEQDLVDLVNRINAQGVETLGRLSPELLVALSQTTLPQLAAYVSTLDPHAPAMFPVTWAGDAVSSNWFDIAREFTERWHHQQQIRLAVNRPGILTPRLYQPVLETFMRALPHTYRRVDAPEGTACEVRVTGDVGGAWRVTRRARRWTLGESVDGAAAAVVVLPADLAWRVFTNGMDAESRARVMIRGDERLGAAVLGARAIVG